VNKHLDTARFRTDSTDSPDCLPILLSISVFLLFGCWFRAVDEADSCQLSTMNRRRSHRSTPIRQTNLCVAETQPNHVGLYRTIWLNPTQPMDPSTQATQPKPSLHGLAPSYLSEYCKLTTGRSHLRSANACLLSVPCTRTTYGDKSFAASGPVAWNSLPMALRSSDVTEETFRRQLKTFLFNCLDNYLVI